MSVPPVCLSVRQMCNTSHSACAVEYVCVCVRVYLFLCASMYVTLGGRNSLSKKFAFGVVKAFPTADTHTVCMVYTHTHTHTHS